MKTARTARQWALWSALFVGALWSPAQALEESAAATMFAPEVLRQHVEYLASTELRGRGSGEKGNEAAARYIAETFRRYGLKPFGTSKQRDLEAKMDGSGYFQPFKFSWGRVTGKSSYLEATLHGKTMRYRPNREFEPASASGSGKAEGELVFVGYGIHAPQAGYTDYANLDVKGKVVLTLAGAPKSDTTKTLEPFGGIAAKIRAARDLGAAALLVVLPKDSDLPANGALDNLDAGLPALRVRYPNAEAWLKAAGQDLNAVWQDADAKKPVSMATQIPIRLAADVQKVEKVTANILGVIEGSDPALKDEYVVIGAHMDHLGLGGSGSLDASGKPAIHHGADDNASGTAGALQIAAYFSAPERRPKRSLLVMCFSAEERGLLGSAYFVNHPTIPLEKTVAMLNMDMIGRLKENRLVVGGAGTAKEWNALIDAANQSVFLNIVRSDSGFGASDHQSFYLKNLPVLFFFTGLHDDYHKPSDTAEKINYYDQARILRVAASVTEQVCNNRERPTFVKRAETEQPVRMRTGRVYFGSVPGYGFDGEGVLLEGVRPGSPAEKAGIKGGDIIIQFGDKIVKNVEDYTAALGAYKPGDVVKVVVKRNGQNVTLTATLTERRTP